MASQEPPADPEDWSDEEWLAWLEAADAAGTGYDEVDEGDGRPMTPTGRLAETAMGQMLGAAMVGLGKALYGQKQDEVQIVVNADGEPHDPEGVEVHLDPDHPDESVVVVRPWLLTGEDPPAD